MYEQCSDLPEILPPTPPLRQFSAVWPVVVAGGLHLERLVEAVTDLDADGEIHGGQPILRTVQESGEISFRHDYAASVVHDPTDSSSMSRICTGRDISEAHEFPLSRSHLRGRLDASVASFVSYDVCVGLRFD